jgi:hypothetical protein
LIKRELEYYPTYRFIIERKERQISLETTGILDISNFNTNFRDNPKCHRIENNFLEVYKYPNFNLSYEMKSMDLLFFFLTEINILFLFYYYLSYSFPTSFFIDLISDNL